jgi:hypothetical protein
MSCIFLSDLRERNTVIGYRGSLPILKSYLLVRTHPDTTNKKSGLYTACPRYRYTKINAYIFVPKLFIKFIFSALYRVTQKFFMHVSTLQCVQLLWLDRYLNDFQVFATCLSTLVQSLPAIGEMCDVTCNPAPNPTTLPLNPERFLKRNVTCYKLNCFNDTLSQISQVSNFSSVHNVLNKPPCKKKV